MTALMIDKDIAFVPVSHINSIAGGKATSIYGPPRVLAVMATPRS